MTQDKTQKTKGKAASAREDRLKAALKANMAKRKSQARGRGAAQGTGANDSEQEKE